jgi:hypothetical protein
MCIGSCHHRIVILLETMCIEVVADAEIVTSSASSDCIQTNVTKDARCGYNFVPALCNRSIVCLDVFSM